MLMPSRDGAPETRPGLRTGVDRHGIVEHLAAAVAEARRFLAEGIGAPLQYPVASQR